MCAVEAVSGRYAVVNVGALRIRLLLAKESGGMDRTRRCDATSPNASHCVHQLRCSRRTRPSRLWDVPFERLRGRTVIASGNRRRDLAVRLLHAQVDHVVIADPYSPNAPLPADARALDVIDNAATYTAFHELRTRAQREAQS